MDSELIENLQVFGLTEYEAKAYAALASIGTASVTEVSQLCDVPRSNLYALLEKLCRKGFVEMQKGRPVLFRAGEPRKIFNETEKNLIEKLKKAKNETLKKLAELKGVKEPEVTPALVWGVRGLNSVIAKINEIIKRSKNEVLINLPNISLLEPSYNELEKARKRGVKIKIVAERKGGLEKFKKVGMIRIREKTHGVDIVADDKEVLVAPSFPIVAAWVDNPEMALHVKDFLNLIWKDAQVLK